MQLLRAGIETLVQIAGEQILVFLDDLIDQGAVRGGHRFEIALAAVVTEQLDDLCTVLDRQVKQHALAPEALANLADQRRQVDVVGVDLVDDDHPADATSGGQLHHLFSREFDTILRIDDHQCGIDRGQGADRLPREVRKTWRIDQMHIHVLPRKPHQGRVQRVAEFLFLRIKVANGVTSFDGTAAADSAGGSEQTFG